MRRGLYFLYPLFLYFFYGLYIGQFQLEIFEPGQVPDNTSGYYDYRGITHVHSDLSSGSASFEEIVQAARESNVDFLFLTDLNTFTSPVPRVGYYGRTLLMRAGEYGYLDSHLLYYGGPESDVASGGGQAQLFFTDLLTKPDRGEDSGLVVLAHPFQPGFKRFERPLEGLDGLEIVNLASQWETAKQNELYSAIWSSLIYPFNSHLAIFRLFQEPHQERALWDELAQKRRTLGFLGNDTSSKTLVFGSVLEFPSYKTSFEIASNHVLLKSELTGDPERDQRKILQALRTGQFYFAIDTLANPKGFFAEARVGRRTYPMGSQIELQKGLQIQVSLPQKPSVPFEVVVFRNGERFLTSNSATTTMDVHMPGVYRVLVRVSPQLPLPDGRRWFPWIYTNPFYIR